jgi:MFS family permease
MECAKPPSLLLLGDISLRLTIDVQVIGSVNTMLRLIYGEAYTNNNVQSNVASIAFAGTVLGHLAFGVLSDRWSRKNSLLISTISMEPLSLQDAFLVLTWLLSSSHSLLLSLRRSLWCWWQRPRDVRGSRSVSLPDWHRYRCGHPWSRFLTPCTYTFIP